MGAATESHCRADLRRSMAQVLDVFAPIAARSREDGIHVWANIPAIFGDPLEGRPNHGQVRHVVSRVVESGIDDIPLSDTLGLANPRQVFYIFTGAREAHPGIIFGPIPTTRADLPPRRSRRHSRPGARASTPRSAGPVVAPTRPGTGETWRRST